MKSIVELNTVFQPIISLKNGNIKGYETLSRTKSNSNIEELFSLAHSNNSVFELEQLCIKSALTQYKNKPKGTKLFINLDSSRILSNESMSSLFEKLSINMNDIVFEVTERNLTQSENDFLLALNECKYKNLKIAIDDFGAKNSGLGRVCKFKPRYLKLDMDLIKNIDSDSMKQAAVSSIVSFCKDISTKIIAEGIETEQELLKLIELGVQYGQGYYIARPEPHFHEIPMWLITQIVDANKILNTKNVKSDLGCIQYLIKKSPTVNYDTSLFDLYEQMHNNHTHPDIFVLKQNNQDYKKKEICGIIKRSKVMEKCSGLYGYNLAKKWFVHEVMDENFLELDELTPLELATTLAMDREQENIYDAIAVTSNDEYVGTVSVKDILLNFVELQVKQAIESNPLTGLPGNSIIQKHIEKCVHSNREWNIVYFDLDNFKAYNDAYGFTNGDAMISSLGQILTKNFSDARLIGHIGGDDFVVIGYFEDIIDRVETVFKSFNNKIELLYNPSDWRKGFIVSTNRHGFIENFSIATISVAIISNKKTSFDSMRELSEKIAHTKKESKKTPGNSIAIG